MEVRFESMVFLWDDKIPTMFLEFMNLLTLCQSEEQLRASVKDFAEKHELDKFFLYGFGSHHFYLHQRYTSDPEMVMQHSSCSVGAGRNDESRSRKGRTCQVRVSRQSP